MIKFKIWVEKRKKRQKMFLSTHYKASSKGLMWIARLSQKKLWQVIKVKDQQHQRNTDQELCHLNRFLWKFQIWLPLKKLRLLKVQSACIMWDKSAFAKIVVNLKTTSAIAMSINSRPAQRGSQWICLSTTRASNFSRVRLRHLAQSTCTSRILKRHHIVWRRVTWLNRIYSQKVSWYGYKTRSAWRSTLRRSIMLRAVDARQTKRSRQVNFDGVSGSAIICKIVLSVQKELTCRTGLELQLLAWVTSAEWWARAWAWVEWQWTSSLQAWFKEALSLTRIRKTHWAWSAFIQRPINPSSRNPCASRYLPTISYWSRWTARRNLTFSGRWVQPFRTSISMPSKKT